MHFAVAHEDLALVKLLDNFGGDATVKSDEGECAIELAERNGIKDVVLHFMSQ